jgi:ABC-2 type transport system ATP-binding protein
MKILTGYVPATTGSVQVAGLPVADHPVEVRRKIGYLPEHNPLYLDMYVHEFLHFMAQTYGLTPAMRKNRVAEMVALCGLTREQNKRIESLSKGYRQRVGLAQALLHQPDVLILDEPTTGLDPNQIIEIRELIKAVSAHRTVLFSTHIMQEVQALCNRVIVINQGKIVADDALAALVARQGGQRAFRADFESPVDVALLHNIAGVQEVTALSPTSVRLLTSADIDVRAAVFRLAADHQWALVGLQQEENSLESIFKALTEAPAV